MRGRRGARARRRRATRPLSPSEESGGTRRDPSRSRGECARTRPAPRPGTGERPRRASRPGAAIRVPGRASAADPSRDGGGDVFLVAAPVLHARARDLAATTDALGDEWGAALGAGLSHRARPHREGALGVVRARVEGLAPLAAPLDQLAAVLGTGDAERHRLGGLALGIARAGHELSEAAVLDHHRLAAGRAELVGGLVGGPLAAAQVLGELALRIGGAREELPEAPPLLHQGLAAVGTGLT